MGKLPILGLALLLLGVVKLHAVGFGFVSGILAGGEVAATPAYVETIGTPAAVALPEELDVTAWFADEPEAAETALWREIDAAFAEARTPTGWTALCAAATTAVGDDRAADPEAGALACSADAGVTALQRLALQVLGTEAALALWIAGEPGHGEAAVDGRQGEVRLVCDAVERAEGADSPVALACADALDLAWQAGDRETSREALAGAYSALATEIAARDPETDAEPVFGPGASAPAADAPAGQADDPTEGDDPAADDTAGDGDAAAGDAP